MKKFEKLREQVMADPERATRVEQFRRAMEDAVRLAEIRERRRLSQSEAGECANISQARMSQIEHAPDVYLSTLDQYVKGLGGRLQVAAIFDDEIIGIKVPSIDQ